MGKCRFCDKEVAVGRITCGSKECLKEAHYANLNRWSVKRYVTITIAHYSAEYPNVLD